MANDWSGNPWVLDTADTDPTSGNNVAWYYGGEGGKIMPLPVNIRKMVWHPNAAADSLVVRNISGSDVVGEVIWQEEAIAAWPDDRPEIDFGDSGQWFPGLHLYTLGGGTLYVYH